MVFKIICVIIIIILLTVRIKNCNTRTWSKRRQGSTSQYLHYNCLPK